MNENENLDVKEISPYSTLEFRQALERLLQSSTLPILAKIYFSHLSLKDFIELTKTLPDVPTFQEKIISTTINSALKQTSDGFSMAGLERHNPKEKCVYISNHRDIVCDPALFTNGMFLAGHHTPKICLGDNLLTSQLVIDLVKMNKGITVKRNLSTRELFKWSVILSSYIRQQIENQVDSVWIAQREGRAKDGNDVTHPGVIKMLNLSGSESLVENIKSLHLVPVSVSYEYDPCDIFKARELYTIETSGTYLKAPNEDTQSIITGIREPKGKIHIEVGEELHQCFSKTNSEGTKKDQLLTIVREIDQKIHLNYKNWPSNYIAFDLLENSDQMSDHYNSTKKQEFIDRIERQFTRLPQLTENDKAGIKKLLLCAYANPVKNAIAATASQTRN